MTTLEHETKDHVATDMEMETTHINTQNHKSQRLSRNIYEVLLAQKKEMWLHTINMFVLCTALILATAYTAISWFDNAYKELTECRLIDDWYKNFAFVIQFGLGILIMSIIHMMGMNIVQHDDADKDTPKDDVCSKSWRYYFPFCILHLAAIIALFARVALIMGRLVDMQKTCQRRLYLLSLGSVTDCPECVEFAAMSIEEKLVAEEQSDVELWGLGDHNSGPIVWWILIEISGIWSIFGAFWANWMAKK